MAVIILLIFLLSGFAGLAYEIVWFKTLSLIFGVSSPAITVVVAAFMGGLALGSLIFGPRADRSRSPLRLYAGLEIGIAISALLLPYLFSLISHLYVLMAQRFPSHSWTFTTGRFLLCFAALLIPTTLMGGTLPAISRFFVVHLHSLGRRVGLLYGTNTMGAVLGCLATGFALLRLLGAHSTTLLAAALNLTAALAAFCIAARRAHIGPVSATKNRQLTEQLNPASESASARRSAAEVAQPWLGTFVIVAFAVAGGTSLAYQVLWTRVLVYFVGMHIYAFTTILATFLVGLALGSFCFAPIADRRKELLLVFGLIELAIGLLAVYLLQTIGIIFLPTHSRSLAELSVLRFAKVSLLILVPTFLMGAAFPIVTKLYTPHVSRLGGSLGNLYAANTIGGVAGSLLAGFVLLPVMGAQKSIILVGAINGLLGMLALLLSPSRTRMRQWALGLAIPCLLVGGFLSTRLSPTVTYCRVFLKSGMNRLYYYREGVEASLAVHGGAFGLRGLNINGVTTAFTDPYDITVHKMLAHVPLLLVNDPRRALIIGFGMGSTARSMACHPLERIDCVELVPEEREAARYFLPENKGVLNDPRVHFIAGDGRNYLLTSRDKYDVISMSAIHPSVSPYLYTREFYKLCRSRLSQDGVMCAWVPSNTLHFGTYLRTFQSVFPHTSLWYSHMGHLVLIGTPQPLRIDFSSWQARMSQPAIRDDLAEIWIDHPVGLLKTLILDEEGVRAMSVRAPVNTDDLPYAAFDSVEARRAGENEYPLFAMFKQRQPEYLRLVDLSNQEAPAQLAERIERGFAGMRYLAEAWHERGWSPDPGRAAELIEQAMAICPEDPRIRFERGVIAFLTMNRQRVPSPDARASAITALEEALHSMDATGGGSGPPERYLAPLRQYLAVLYFSGRRFSEAKREAELVLQVEPNSAPARYIIQMASSVK